MRFGLLLFVVNREKMAQTEACMKRFVFFLTILIVLCGCDKRTNSSHLYVLSQVDENGKIWMD